MLRYTLIALSVIGCLAAPTAASACISPSPKVRQMVLREQAKQAIVKIDERLAKATLSDADLAKVKDLRVRAGKSAAAGKSSAAIDKVAAILKILGVPYGEVFGYPTKCG